MNFDFSGDQKFLKGEARKVLDAQRPHFLAEPVMLAGDIRVDKVMGLQGHADGALG